MNELYYRPKNVYLLLDEALRDKHRARDIYLFILDFCRYESVRNLCYKNLLFLLEGGFAPKPLARQTVPARRIIATMTTCKRFDLFKRTITSFLTNVDTECIDKLIIVDDGSSQEDIGAMKLLTSACQFPTIIMEKTLKGHAHSINMIRDLMIQERAEFFIHLEDDFDFFYPFPLIRMCAEVLLQFPQYGQCLFSNSYKEERRDFATLPWGAQKCTESGLVFYEHVWKDVNNPHGYWPGFSLRPGLNRTRMWREVGEVIHRGSFEKDYATRCAVADWKIAYLEVTSCEHIGRKTTEKFNLDKYNAYTLNNSVQFDNFCFEPVHFARDPKILMGLKEPEILHRLFLKNFEEIARETVLGAIAHTKIWSNLVKQYKNIQAYLVYDSSEPPALDLWKSAYYALNGFDPWDILLIPNHTTKSLRKLDKLIEIPATYLIHYTGALKLLNFIKEEGWPEDISAVNLITFQAL